jgi:hypothetical protein
VSSKEKLSGHLSQSCCSVVLAWLVLCGNLDQEGSSYAGRSGVADAGSLFWATAQHQGDIVVLLQADVHNDLQQYTEVMHNISLSTRAF